MIADRLTDRQLRILAWAGWWFFVAALAASGLLDLAEGRRGHRVDPRRVQSPSLS